MFFIISKLFTFLLSPITWVFLLLVSCIFAKNKKRRIIITLCVFYFFSNSFISSEVMRLLEPKHQAITENYKAIVVLAGFVAYDDSTQLTGFAESIDRLLYGLKEHQKNTNQYMIISGGSGSLSMPEMKESTIARNFVKDLNINTDKIINEPFSKNTFQNALYTKTILKKLGLENEKILLVTSAYHIPRAKACFDKQGINSIIYPVDYKAGPRKYNFDHLLLPSLSAFQDWYIILHEWVGLFTYRLKSYI
jgi:uncharacterized SAM-binding protein YcdF (DUF218 family)